MRVRAGAGLAVLCGVLAVVGCLRGQQEPAPRAVPQPPRPKTEPQIEQLQADLDLLDQLNRLDLTQAQARKLMDAARQISARALAPLPPKARPQAETLQTLLQRKKEILLRDEGVPSELEEQIKNAKAALDEALDEDANAQVADGAALLRKALSEDQVKIIVGADLALQRAQEMLDYFRGMSQEDFAASAANEAATTADLSPDQTITSEQLLSVWRQARQISQEQYNRERAKLAEKTAGAYGWSPQETDSLLVQWAVDEAMIRVLEEKLPYLPQ